MSVRRRRFLEGARDSFASPGAFEETAWLIERGQAVNHAPTIWWAGPDRRPLNDYPEFWTTDATTARRFATREAAFTIAERLFGFSGRETYTLTEHVFLGGVRG